MALTYADTALKIEQLIARMERLEKASTAARWWDIMMKFSMPLVLGIVGTTINQEMRLTKIEATRFTATDAAVMERKMIERLADALKSDLGEIKQLLQGMDARMRNVEQKVVK